MSTLDGVQSHRKLVKAWKGVAHLPLQHQTNHPGAVVSHEGQVPPVMAGASRKRVVRQPHSPVGPSQLRGRDNIRIGGSPLHAGVSSNHGAQNPSCPRRAPAQRELGLAQPINFVLLMGHTGKAL